MSPDVERSNSVSTMLQLRRMTLVVTLLVAIVPPLLTWAHRYEDEENVLRTEAEINAQLFGDLINRSPELWKFQTDKLETLLARRLSFGTQAESRRIVDLDGSVIAASVRTVPRPHLSTRSPLLDAGVPVAWLEIERSVRPILLSALWVTLGSLAFSGLLYGLVMQLPLRALSDTLGQLNAERDKALLTLRSIGDAVITTDAAQRIEYLNPVAESLSGWSTEDARGRPIAEVLHLVHSGSQQTVPNPVAACLATGRIVDLERHTVLVRRGDQQTFHIEDSAAPIFDRDGSLLGAILVFHDISDRVQAQQQLQHAAFHDALTGLPNRDLFRTRLMSAMDEARRGHRAIAVLFLDLDRFKAINDSLGHSVGDELLVLAAKRIRHCVRESDLVCRLGGDEFTALLHNVEDEQAARTVAHKILNALSLPFHIGQHHMRVSASMGIALFPGHGETAEELLKNADTAMYWAKDQGRNNLQFYAEAMNAHASEQLRMAFALQLALERDEYRVVFQPKLRLSDGRVVAVEALLRWHNPELDAVSPAQFIPQLEESGAIVEVGRWVLKTALQQAKRWLESGHPLRVAVNVSAVQFRQPNLVSAIATMLQECELPPEYLQIELTESLLMDDVTRSAQVIAELTQLGVKLSLDDFGTGYSSLAYLRRFAVHELKIDRSFVGEIGSNGTADRIVQTVIDLGHALDMEVTAEGVETEEQATLLRDMGCDLLQGFWLARPMPYDQLERWLQARKPA